jgi:phenylpropionate dioxygenase-like ring-hydroxylating dioxygenase large terminal subunit
MSGAKTAPLSRNQVASRTNELDAAGELRVYRSFRWFWHAVMRAEDLGDEPQRVTLCEENLVIVRLNGEVCAFNDLCAHRGTALSLGKVVDGATGEQELRCPYHGWRYDRGGFCTLAPQRPDLAGRLRARVRKFLCQERYGLVWVCLEDEPRMPLPEFPQYDQEGYHNVHFPVVDWKCSAPRRVENYTDVAHFAFVHDGWLGDINHPEIHPYRVWREGAALMMAEEDPVLHPAKFSKWAGAETEGEYVEVLYTRSIFMPLVVRLDIRSRDRQYSQFFCPTPIGPKETRNFTIVARNFGTPETAFRDHAEFNMIVYEQDRPIVESQRPEELPEDLSYEMYLQGVDTYSMEYRRWLLDLANELVTD